MFIMKAPNKLRLVIVVILLLTAVFSIYFSFREERNGILTVAFLDVGQGDAIFIEAPNGNQILIDGGPSKQVLRELSKVMPFYDRSIDAVLLTHTDQDHVGGLPDVLKKYKVGILMESGVSGKSSSYEELKKMVSESPTTGQSKKILARKGMIVDLGDGAKLEIIFPITVFDGMETNNASIVARLVYGENEFLFTGDSPIAIENYLAFQEDLKSSNDNSLQSDVLKVAHHGSKNSDSSKFVSAVSPEYAVISVGKDNKYGHPNQETLDTLNNFGAKILRTDELGRIIFKSDGVNLEITHS
jgi:competence protein ComEC